MGDGYTADDYEQAIALAISARDFDAVEALIAGMAVRWPARAELVIATIRVGLAARKAGA